MQPKYPNITIKLSGKDGNALAILGLVMGAMQSAGVTKEEVSTYYDEATAGDYDNLIQVTMKWVDVQ